MEYLKRLEPVALLLLVLGGLNWAIVGFFDENVLANIFASGTALDAAYVVVGLPAVVFVAQLLRRLMEVLHIDTHPPRPHGA